MRIISGLGLTFLVSIAFLGLKNQPTKAVTVGDGTVYFDFPPSLVKAVTTYKEPQVPSTYYFTLSLPAQAGEPLSQVTFTQFKGVENIKFDLKQTEAVAETSSNSKQRLVTEVTRDRQTKTIAVTFNPPVTPGQTIRVGLHAFRNPLFGGIYLFGVKAFPAGEKTHGQFLGYGRLQFISPGGRF